MRQPLAIVTLLGFLLPMAFSAGAQQVDQVDKEKLKKKAQEQAERDKDVNEKARSNRDRIDDDDDDGHVGAIVGGVAAVAVVGTLIAKTTGGDDHEVKETTVSFGSMDANKDGKLARDEFISAMSDAFESSDKNGDGKVTRDEAVAAYGDRGGKYFDALDSEKSGSISVEALERDAREAFHWADADGDGSITAAERTKATAENDAAEKKQKADPTKKAKRLLRKVT